MPSGGRKCLSLEELCVRTAIDNLDFIGDVGGLDSQFLKIILPHCTAEQLLNIEEATKDRDLSPITNELWKKCYVRKFGEENVKMVMSKMKAKNKFFKWKALYQAKLREQDELEKQCVKSLTEKYKAAGEQKASRQLQQIDLVPPSSKKRQLGSVGSTARFGQSSSTSSNSRGRLMKKARQEFAATVDAKRIAAARKKPVLPGRR
ncbi:unnamed protein product [Calypogeia fissa]